METSAWQLLIDEGYDVTLIEENLRLTPTERINNQSSMAESVMQLRDAMRSSLIKSDRAPSDTQSACRGES
ncbi:hypothetical protein [Cerasicoccus maritimus]|uniref:hypothetical protein n=1 Tax=Cerasicoccus maritimus TaxID=490089 RepID=UPI002852585A|nr:hypothetical protein [Cerasicoccus maritimus]